MPCLRAISCGSTHTCREIAQRLGQPTAARACATIPVAVVIPCHRVVRGDGGLGGYHWGLERKQALLAQELDGARPLDPTSRRPKRARR